jgi:hypothetical protein
MSSLSTFHPRAKQLAHYANDLGQAFKDCQPLDGERVADGVGVLRRLMVTPEFIEGQRA